MSVTAVCTRRIGTDLVALSAFDTLVRKMGYGSSLVALSREETWILVFDVDDAKAGETTKELAEKTGIFANPNTHAHAIVRPDETLPHGVECGREKLGILVWSHEDPQTGPVAVAVRERMGVQSLTELRRLIMWWPRLAEGGGQIAASMAPTRSRKEGLLANPHYQCWSIIENGLRPRELLSTIEEIEKGSAVKP